MVTKVTVGYTGSHLSVIDVVNFIEDDVGQIIYDLALFVQHGAQDFCGHDETASLWVELKVTRY